MNNFLDEIRKTVIERVKTIETPSASEPQERPNFLDIFSNAQRPIIISEVKFASPSKGQIYYGTLSPVEIAMQYQQNGAAALSVLTEPYFFKGNIEYLQNIVKALPETPVLLKDFILSPTQILEAYHAGASAILLIVSFLEPTLLEELYTFALSLGLTPLIEIHDKAELAEALKLNPKLIGINNRNLNTLAINIETSIELIRMIPANTHAISESGIHTLGEINMLSALGFDGFLIGSHMMQTDNPGQALGSLLKDRHAR